MISFAVTEGAMDAVLPGLLARRLRTARAVVLSAVHVRHAYQVDLAPLPLLWRPF